MRLIGPLLVAFALLASGACARHGREVFLREGCGGCHTFRGEGGGLAPDLSDVAVRRDAAALRSLITNPASRNPASRMPLFPQMSWYDLHSLVAFLRS